MNFKKKIRRANEHLGRLRSDKMGAEVGAHLRQAITKELHHNRKPLIKQFSSTANAGI